MTPREALDAVGLASLEGVTSDSLRRAYLRKLREHPPERDPDGFAHLRAAFEMVRAQLELHAQVAAGRMRLVVVQASPDRRADARVVAVPVAPPPPDASIDSPVAAPVISPRPAPPMRLGELVPELLSLLLAGKVDEAVELEARWRADGGDDCRVIGAGDAARWLFVRELVGVARELPEGVRHPLTVAVRDGDFRGAGAVLADFRLRNHDAALLADGVLQRRAPSIHVHVRGCLVLLPTTSRPNPPVIKRSDAWPIIRVIIAVLAVIGAVTSQRHDHPSSSPPDPQLQQIPIPPEAQRAVQTAAPPAALALQPAASPDEDPNIADVVTQCLLIENPAKPASKAQRAAAAALRAAIWYSCDARSMALHDLEQAAPLPDRDDAAMAAGAIRLIEIDVDALCPGAAPPLP